MHLDSRVRPPLRLVLGSGAVALIGLAAFLAGAAWGSSRSGSTPPGGVQLLEASQPPTASPSLAAEPGGEASAAPQATPNPEPTATPAPTVSPTPAPSPSGKPRSTPRPSPTPTPSESWHIPVLLYHLIATPLEAGDAQYGLVVSPKLFADQMKTLHDAGWHAITAAELGRALEIDLQPPAKTFVITIDDGYVDGYTEAFPILRENGFAATYYLPTGRIGWTRILTARQVTEMAAAGMEMADHSVSHIDLTSLSIENARAEIIGPIVYLEALLGSRPTTFAYPFGFYNEDLIKEVDDAGFSIAFTTATNCRESFATRFATPRLGVGPTMTAARLLASVRGCNG
jgi:peptidoglycan/xylan/chitin deacetylase (PgdA/CDA1 family)